MTDRLQSVNRANLSSEGLELNPASPDEPEPDPEPEIPEGTGPEGIRKHVRMSHQGGKCERTIQRQKKAKLLMEAKGFLLLPEFFKHMAKKVRRQGEVAAAKTTETEETAEAHAGTAVTAEAPAATVATAEAATNVTAAVTMVTAGAAMVIGLEEVAVGEDGQDTGADADNEYDVGNRTAVTVEEEEEEEEEGEEGVATPMPSSDGGDLGDFENVLKSCWGPTQMVLYECKESSSDFSGSKSNLEDLEGTETWKLDSDCQGNTPDNATAKQPTISALEILRDRERLEASQRELAVITRQRNLDRILQDHVAAMIGLLNLYLDRSLGYTWIKASEINSKTGVRSGTTHAQSTRSWTLSFMRT